MAGTPMARIAWAAAPTLADDPATTTAMSSSACGMNVRSRYDSVMRTVGLVLANALRTCATSEAGAVSSTYTLTDSWVSWAVL